MDEETSRRTFGSRIASFMPLLVSAGGVVLLLGAAGILAWRVFGMDGEGSETLRFIALLIVFMVAMAATAALFVALRMGNPGEAFGLPSGSIRALLALGIMMLFVVFGMPVLTVSDAEIERVDTVASAAQLTEAVRSYREQGYLVAVLDSGATEARNAAGTVTAPARNARLRIVGRLPTRSPDQVDLTKQLLTAIITLLTTVIGFYFGSRSSTDAIRETTGGSDHTSEPRAGPTMNSPESGSRTPPATA